MGYPIQTFSAVGFVSKWLNPKKGRRCPIMQNLMRAFMTVLQKSMQKLLLEGSLSLLQWYPWYPWPWHLHYITKISLKSSQSDTCDLNRDLVNLLTHGQFIIFEQLHDNSIKKSNNNSHCAVTKRLHLYDDMYDNVLSDQYSVTFVRKSVSLYLAGC